MKIEHLKAIAFTHKNAGVELLPQFHIHEDHFQRIYTELKSKELVDELVIISTCNRKEFIFTTNHNLSSQYYKELFSNIYPEVSDISTDYFTTYEGEKVARHLMEVASSLDSMVIGEREIITQVRKAYDFCNTLGMTDEILRILFSKTIETAKTIYTHTEIANKPVSVVSLAYRELVKNGLNKKSKVLIIGAGETNAAMVNYLKKHNIESISIFNRTLTKAESLAEMCNANAYSLTELKNHADGFDIIITCTGSADVIINESVYSALLQNDHQPKTIVDLAIPYDFDREIRKHYALELIGISELKQITEANLKDREVQIAQCNVLIEEGLATFNVLMDERKVELAFGEIPLRIKAAKDLAIREVFAKEYNQLDEKQKTIVLEMLEYMEKKCNAISMTTAKKVLLTDGL